MLKFNILPISVTQIELVNVQPLSYVYNHESEYIDYVKKSIAVCDPLLFIDQYDKCENTNLLFGSLFTWTDNMYRVLLQQNNSYVLTTLIETDRKVTISSIYTIENTQSFRMFDIEYMTDCDTRSLYNYNKLCEIVPIISYISGWICDNPDVVHLKALFKGCEYMFETSYGLVCLDIIDKNILKMKVCCNIKTLRQSHFKSTQNMSFYYFDKMFIEMPDVFEHVFNSNSSLLIKQIQKDMFAIWSYKHASFINNYISNDGTIITKLSQDNIKLVYKPIDNAFKIVSIYHYDIDKICYLVSAKVVWNTRLFLRPNVESSNCLHNMRVSEKISYKNIKNSIFWYVDFNDKTYQKTILEKVNESKIIKSFVSTHELEYIEDHYIDSVNIEKDYLYIIDKNKSFVLRLHVFKGYDFVRVYGFSIFYT